MANGALSIIDTGSSKSCSSKVAINITDPRDVDARKYRGNAAIVTLGCSKNQVDSEVMLGVLRNNGFQIVNELANADVAIVNTCGFLESAVKESIDAVLEAAKYKSGGRLRKLIVAGCMVSRYKEELKSTLPEADAFLSTDEILKVGGVAAEEFSETLNEAARPYFLYDETMPREIASLKHFAYVKVAEGCNRPCTFCVIPQIRGTMRSRSVESVVREVSMLGAQGVKEVNLVAQDLTSYGLDRKGEKLADLLRALDQSASVDWVRLLYAYPIGIDVDLLRAIVELPRICTYLDLPLQHASDTVLRAMKRPLGQYSPKKIAEFIRTTSPEIALRTTFIVGFPGETESDVDELEKMISDGYFSSVGIFTYSREPGTPAYDMPNQVDEDAKEDRRARLMEAQRRVVESKLESLVGTTQRVLVDGYHEETDLLLSGRAEFQAPDVDGVVIINDTSAEESIDNAIGQFRDVEITEVAGYDLVGKVIENSSISIL